MDDLRGGDAAFNAGAIRAVLAGERGPNRDIGVLNAAAALMVIGQVDDLAHGVQSANDSIDEGRAEAALEALISTSQAAAVRIWGLKARRLSGPVGLRGCCGRLPRRRARPARPRSGA